MNRVHWKFLLVGAVVAIALSVESRQVNAQWAGWYQPTTWSSCCTVPYYPAAYTVGYTPYYRTSYVVGYTPYVSTWGRYVGWRPGPVRRWLFGPYRWYRGPVGWPYATTAIAYDPCCTTDVTTETPAASPTPAAKPAPMPAPTYAPQQPSDVISPAPAEPKTSQRTPDTSGTLSVLVPSDAKVTVNGRETQSTGTHRQFVSHGLKAGFSYKYVVRAEVVRNGVVREDTRTLILTAGQTTALAFGFNTSTTEGLALAQ